MTLLARFQLKRILAVAAGITAGAAGSAAAQSAPLRLPDNPRPGSVVRVPSQPAQPVHHHSYPRYAYPVAVTYIPAVLMSDGSVWANFGHGYLPVRRPCRQSRVLDSRGMSGRYGVYDSPAPAQQTQSAANLPSVQAQRRVAEQAAYNACYTRTGQGSLVVVR